MDMRLVIEHMPQAGLQVEADMVLAYINRAQDNAKTIQAMWAEVEADILVISGKLLELSRRLAGRVE